MWERSGIFRKKFRNILFCFEKQQAFFFHLLTEMGTYVRISVIDMKYTSTNCFKLYSEEKGDFHFYMGICSSCQIRQSTQQVLIYF